MTLLSELMALNIDKFNLPSNYIVYHIFNPIQYIIVAWAYYQEFRKKQILISMPIMVIWSLILSVFIQPITEFNSYYISFELLIFTAFSVYYFLLLLRIETDNKLKDYPLFWISCGWLLFSVANLFVFGTYNSFFKENSYIERVFAYIRVFSNYILYSLFIVAFLVKQHTLLGDERK
jgi:hypothetical protein